LSHALFSSFDVDQGTRLLLKAVARDPVLAGARRVLDEGCGVGVIGLCVAKAFPEAEVFLRDRDSLAIAFTERNRLLNKLRGTTAWKDPKTGVERLARPAPSLAWGLLGDGREDGPYDFVLSNLPAKAGAPVLASFFARLSGARDGSAGHKGAAGHHNGPALHKGAAGPDGPALLAPGGRAAVVIVKPLAEAAAAWIAEANLAVVATARGSGHEVFVVERGPRESEIRPEASAEGAEALPPSTPKMDLAVYLRGESRFKLADLSYRAKGFWGLPEFDTPGYGNSVSAEVLSRVFAAAPRAKTQGQAAPEGPGREPGMGSCAEVLLIEPGAGHLAIWVARELRPKRLTAASRDELALEATESNLAALPERFRPVYVPVDALSAANLAPASFDLLAECPEIVPERDWTLPAWERAGRLLRPGGVFLACCSPTEAARFEKRRPTAGEGRWSLLCRRRKKGFVASAWRRS
jgi:hypothetical protein